LSLYLSCLLYFQFITFAQDWSEQHSGTISAGHILSGSFSNINLQSEATISVQHIVNLEFCLQRLVELPDQNTWSQSCTTYLTFSSTPQPSSPKRTFLSLAEILKKMDGTQATFAAATENYNWGIGVVNANQNDTVSLNFTGATCPAGQGWNGTNCAALVQIDSGSAVYTDNPGGIALFYFTVPTGSNNVSVSVTSNSTSTTFNTYLRYSGTPSSAINDQTGSNTLLYANPRPGQWQLAVNLATGVPGTQIAVNVKVNTCPAGTYGPACNTPVIGTDPSNIVYSNLVMDGFTYFSVSTVPSLGLWISFQARNSEVDITVYGTIGTLPSSTNYIFKGCNKGPCDPVTLIKLDNSTALLGNETWIFGVFTSQNATAIGNNSTQLGVWINSVCAPECGSPSGVCDTNTGLCQCEDSYTGIDCTLAIGLPSQYIVLIIIASLVVISAVIGFIAWAYMRKRRRVHYEKVV